MNPKNFFFIGMPYTGKSYAGALLCKINARPFTVIVHNVKRDISYLQQIDIETMKFIGVTSSNFTLSPSLLDRVRKDFSYLWLTVYDLNPKQLSSFLDSLAYACSQSGNLLLLIDEARMFCATRYVSDYFIGFIRGARRKAVDLALISHRYTDIDINIRCVFNFLIVFRIVEPVDLEALRTTSLGVRVKEVPALESRFHLFVNTDQGSVSGPQMVGT